MFSSASLNAQTLQRAGRPAEPTFEAEPCADIWGKALFVQRRLPAYRVPFVLAAQRLLRAQGVTLDFAYGTPSPREQLKRDEGELPGAVRLATRYLLGRACWQPFRVGAADLVIVSQENSLLFNHWLCRPWRGFKLAFFGHGGNLASRNPNSLVERYKRFTTRQADWWFGYTALSQRLLAKAGFSADRVTVLNNAVDTESLRAQLAGHSADQAARLRVELGLVPGKTGLFMGSLYSGKGLELLIEAASMCAEQDPQFRLVVVGDGEAAPTIRAASASLPWLHWPGALHGADRIKYLAVADFMLIPGSVGLAILDGFAAGLPIITTDMVGHGPELEYLNPGVNGEVTAHDAQAYARAIGNMLEDPGRLSLMRDSARASSRQYSVTAMAAAFSDGVIQALRAGPARRGGQT